MRSILFGSLVLMLLNVAAFGQILFVDMAQQLNMGEAESSFGVAIVDLNQDGTNEIFVTNVFGVDRLYMWNGTVYEDVAPEYGVNQTYRHHNVCIADIDKDMRPDLFVTGDPYGNIGRYYVNRGYPPFLDMAIPFNLQNVRDMGSTFFQLTRHTRLSGLIGGTLMVWQDSQFIDVTQGSGLESMNNVHCPIFLDIDGDIDDDLFIAGNHEENSGRLFRNNGNGTFTDISTNSNAGGFPIAQGATMGDIDNDGDFDLYLQSGFGDNSMWLNDGTGYFIDFTYASHTGVDGYSRGACFGDYDNDGDLDLFLNRATASNILFRNNGAGIFTDISFEAGVTDYGNGYGCANGDINNDGQLDIVALNCDDQQNQVLINQNSNENYLKVRVKGLEQNYLALGAKVRLYGVTTDCLDTVLIGIREVQSMTSLHSVNDPTVHFGTGPWQNLIVDVVFQSWNHVTAYDIQPGHTVHIYEYPSDIDDEPAPVPDNYLLVNAYPNPFNSSANITITGGTGGDYNLAIYDVLGRLIKNETIGIGNANQIRYSWNGTDKNGEKITSGLYLLKVTNGIFQTQKMLTLIK
jgi:enediyne biosynthesis protein E4